MFLNPDLYTLSLFAGERGLHHAVVLSQGPGLVDELDIVASGRRDAVGSQRVLPRRLRGSFGVVNIKNHVSFAHVKVPGDDRGGIYDLNQDLKAETRRKIKYLELQDKKNMYIFYQMEDLRNVAIYCRSLRYGYCTT